jgi:hypothetical protein
LQADFNRFLGGAGEESHAQDALKQERIVWPDAFLTLWIECWTLVPEAGPGNGQQRRALNSRLKNSPGDGPGPAESVIPQQGGDGPRHHSASTVTLQTVVLVIHGG